MAQNDGEIYNDHTTRPTATGCRGPSFMTWNATPVEACDAAERNPEIVARLLAELDREMGTLPEDAQADVTAALKRRKASVVTPPGAAPACLIRNRSRRRTGRSSLSDAARSSQRPAQPRALEVFSLFAYAWQCRRIRSAMKQP